MAIDFPNSPTNGQVFTVGSRTWTYSTTTGVWTQSSGPIVNAGSATIAGPLQVSREGAFPAPTMEPLAGIEVLGSGTQIAVVTANITGSTGNFTGLNVTAVTSGTIAIGMLVTDASDSQYYPADARISAFGTGTGGIGTYTVSHSAISNISAVTIVLYNTSASPAIRLRNTNTATSSAAPLGSIQFSSDDASTLASGTRASLNVRTTGTTGAADFQIDLAPAGAVTRPVMRIDSAGNLFFPQDLSNGFPVNGSTTTTGQSLTGTGWAIGNGTIQSFFANFGKQFIQKTILTFGTTSTFGTGEPSLALWFAGCAVSPRNHVESQIQYVDSSAAATYLGTAVATTSTSGSSCSLTFRSIGSSGLSTAMSSTAPFTWASGDIIRATWRWETP